MSSDSQKLVLTSGRLNSERGQSYFTGQFGGQEDAAKAAREVAGKLFAAGKDAEAKIWRDTFAPWLEERAEKLRKEAGEHRKQFIDGGDPIQELKDSDKAPGKP